MNRDREINALSNVYEALKGLNNTQIKRILIWITSKFELHKKPVLKAVEREVESLPQTEPSPSTLETIKSIEEPEKKSYEHPPVEVQPIREKKQPQTAAAGISGFMKYDSLKAIFSESTVKTTGAKILLAAAYLQENENFKELSSYNITSRMKNIGQPIKNSSIAINSLMSKRPPLLLQTGTHGTGLKSRRKFRVTVEGLRIARNYIDE